jgi:hypothetical protein
MLAAAEAVLALKEVEFQEDQAVVEDLLVAALGHLGKETLAVTGLIIKADKRQAVVAVRALLDNHQQELPQGTAVLALQML